MGRLHVYYEQQVDFEKIRNHHIDSFFKVMQKKNLDALLVTRIENVFALTRWRAPYGRYHYVQRYGAILTKDKRVIKLTRTGDILKVKAVMPWIEDIRPIPDMPGEGLGGWVNAVKEVLSDYHAEKGLLGVDLITLQLFYDIKKELPKLEIIDIDNDIMTARSVKSEDEIKAMKLAYEVAELGLEAGLALAKPGVTECSIAARISEVMIAQDAEGLHLTPHVITGEHSSVKYRHMTDRQIRFGDVVRIDCGCTYIGYVGEYNRTTIAGRPSPRQREVAKAVYEAHTKCLNSVKPGIKASEVDRIARQSIIESGFERYQHRHPTGHGVGLAVHELPSISENANTELVPGMVFCLEPGIWVYDDPSIGGIVFEDAVVVTRNGFELLTRTEYCSKLLGFEACPMGKY